MKKEIFTASLYSQQVLEQLGIQIEQFFVIGHLDKNRSFGTFALIAWKLVPKVYCRPKSKIVFVDHEYVFFDTNS